MANQTDTQIKTEFTKFLSVMELPQVVHLDQRANFKSTILRQTYQLMASKVKNYIVSF